MRAADLPPNESERLAKLAALGVLDTAPDRAFDDLTALAAQICGTPIALVSLVDECRQWFKSHYGLESTETPREVSFCAHVVDSSEPLLVQDASSDPRFADNPLVTGEPNVRFYAGMPLQYEGVVLGTLCVIDRRARELRDDQIAALQKLARVVVDQLQLIARTREAESATLSRDRAKRDYERIFALSLDMLCTARADGYFETLNPAWTEALGYTQDELKARPFIEFVHPDDRERTTEEANVLVTGARSTISFENRYRHKDGSYRSLLWSARYDPGVGLILAAARDITFLKETEAELRESRDAADRANRVKSEFLARMSHELRTPLNSVIGFTNLLLGKHRAGFGATESNYLERVADNGRHLLQLINDVLDLSKLEAGRVELQLGPVDVVRAVEDALGKLEGRLSESAARLYLVRPAAPGLLTADRRRLEQIVINLVANAVKFTDGGAIEVRVIAEATTGRPMRLEVADTGAGIAASLQERIFAAFEQADGGAGRMHEGTGLGLAITRALCEQMGFRVDLASEEQRGAVFAVHFDPSSRLDGYTPPREHRDALWGQRERHDDPAPRPSPKHGGLALVVDDDSDARELLGRYLGEIGFDVIVAGSGVEGLALARARHPALITLDLRMPGTNGWQVLRELRDDPALQDVPVIICSVSGSRYQLLAAGSVQIVDKPIDQVTFASVVSRALATASSNAVLVVEDDAEMAELIAQWVRACGARPSIARDGQQALEALDSLRPALVFVDLLMPVVDGFEFLRQLESRPTLRSLPVVICTARTLSAKERAIIDGRANSVIAKSDGLEADIRAIVEQYLGLSPIAGTTP